MSQDTNKKTIDHAIDRLSGNPPLQLPSCIVVIPAHNESRDIGHVIGKIREHSNFPVVVVDDASTDDTISKAREAGARVVPLAVQLGAWGATQTGLRFALSNDYTYAITMDADGQHLAESLPALLDPIIKKEAEVAIGACTKRGSVLRRIA
jgi:glycosyltransferase involved in cell wall biosynthesis